jgi:DNA polymerase V
MFLMLCNKSLLFLDAVSAGFPSPASDYSGKKTDLNKYLIKHPNATFFVKATGDSMINAGIGEGDVLVVDRALKPKDGLVVIAYIDSGFTVKRFIKLSDGNFYLAPENPKYSLIPLSTSEREIIIWGVVTYVIKSLNIRSS